MYRARHTDVNTQIKTLGLIHKQNSKNGHFIYFTDMVRLSNWYLLLLLDEQLRRNAFLSIPEPS